MNEQLPQNIVRCRGHWYSISKFDPIFKSLKLRYQMLIINKTTIISKEVYNHLQRLYCRKQTYSTIICSKETEHSIHYEGRGKLLTLGLLDSRHLLAASPDAIFIWAITSRNF